MQQCGPVPGPTTAVLAMAGGYPRGGARQVARLPAAPVQCDGEDGVEPSHPGRTSPCVGSSSLLPGPSQFRLPCHRAACPWRVASRHRPRRSRAPLSGGSRAQYLSNMRTRTGPNPRPSSTCRTVSCGGWHPQAGPGSRVFQRLPAGQAVALGTPQGPPRRTGGRASTRRLCNDTCPRPSTWAAWALCGAPGGRPRTGGPPGPTLSALCGVRRRPARQ